MTGAGVALDTNVLVRFLVQDDPGQAALAGAVMAGLNVEAPGHVCREVLVELVWVLERAYGRSRAEVAGALEGLLAAPEIALEADDDTATAILRYRDEGQGFADLMIAAAAGRAGVPLVTFDRSAARIAGVTLLG
jgi:predicted nucleic-acid-binding protein